MFCKINVRGDGKQWVQLYSVEAGGFVNFNFLQSIADGRNWTDEELGSLTDELTELEIEYNFVDQIADVPAHWDWRVL